MNIITLTAANLENEHICCAIANNKDIQVASKKAWLAQRLADGLVFKKCDVRGKCFIEYIPGEKAWYPIEAEGYMHINCFWVSGQHKGQGYANLLLQQCIDDSKAQNRQGLTVISSKKKRPFLADPDYLKYRGFIVADSCAPFYQLLYLPFTPTAAPPHFKEHLKVQNSKSQLGFVLYYSDQCPFTAKYVPLLLEAAQTSAIDLKLIHLDSLVAAQNAPSPSTAFSLFYNGEFITNEILTVNKFIDIVATFDAK